MFSPPEIELQLRGDISVLLMHYLHNEFLEPLLNLNKLAFIAPFPQTLKPRLKPTHTITTVGPLN